MTLAMCGQNVGCLKSNSSVSLFGNLFVAVILPFIFGNPRICPQTARGWGGGVEARDQVPPPTTLLNNFKVGC